MVFFFGFEPFTNIFTLANSKYYENVFLDKGKEIWMLLIEQTIIQIKTIGSLY